MFRLLLAAIALAAIVTAPTHAGGLYCALSRFESDEAEEAYIQELRAEGPAGLEKALARFDQLTQLTRERFPAWDEDGGNSSDESIEAHRVATEGCDRISRVVDLIAGQRGATASRLYWYTDLDEAKAAAAESGKPILSLRMLGKLTDEYSCANSRFFRTALYTNREISDYLRDNYVLHWQSVRPLPLVTIEFGDGRKLERTVTGNSAHYVLDANGRPLDVLPGLYGPQAFGAWLGRSLDLHTRYAECADETERAFELAKFHETRRRALVRDLQSDLAEVAPEMLGDGSTELQAALDVAGMKRPTAAAAGRIALTKSGVEAPIVAAISPDVDRAAALGGEVWQRIAQLPRHAVVLDQGSSELMRREFPAAAVAGARAESKRRVEDPLVALVRTFESSIALDAVKNEYLLHRRIHDWYVAGQAPEDFDALNERVYAELFLTPSSDPWLGLAPADAYTGLDGGGLTAGAATGSQLGAAP